jgi:hypothetical protein
MATETKHRQVAVGSIQVDEGLASLLKSLWLQGIDALASCQEWKEGMAFLRLATMGDLKRFRKLTDSIRNEKWEQSITCDMEFIEVFFPVGNIEKIEAAATK